MPQTFKPPATQRVYDVCVIGSQLGGVAAGALLARRGFRVLYVDHDGLGASYEDAGYLLPYAPAILPSPRAFPSAETVLGELGLTTDLGRQLEPCDPDLQLLMPRHRVDLPRDPATRLAEMRREWPADAERLDAGFEELQRLFDAATPFLKSTPPLPPRGFGERRAVSKALRFAASAPGAPPAVAETRPFAAMADHPLVQALRTAHRFLSYCDGEPAPLGLVRLLGAALRGTYRLPGGHHALREALRRKIAESRGELLGASSGEPAIAEALELDGKRVASVRLAGSKDAYVARAYIAATDAPAVKRLLPADAGRVAATLDRVRPSRQMLAVNLVVKTAALPPALGEASLALRDGTAGDGAVLMQVLPARRATKKGPGEPVEDERVLCAAAFVPATARDGGEAALRDLAAGIRAEVADAVPFFERHLVRESVPFLAAPGTGRGSRFAPHPLYQVESDQTLGVTGLPVIGALKNLVFAGREVIPGLGIEGEFHAGLQAANEVVGLLGKKDLLK